MKDLIESVITELMNTLMKKGSNANEPGKKVSPEQNLRISDRAEGHGRGWGGGNRQCKGASGGKGRGGGGCGS